MLTAASSSVGGIAGHRGGEALAVLICGGD
jgi:hypothetical protein